MKLPTLVTERSFMMIPRRPRRHLNDDESHNRRAKLMRVRHCVIVVDGGGWRERKFGKKPVVFRLAASRLERLVRDWHPSKNSGGCRSWAAFVSNCRRSPRWWWSLLYSTLNFFPAALPPFPLRLLLITIRPVPDKDIHTGT
ncbi:hypothetical protein GWI33_016526 [Rhynchophorus ferrugineus]|uniref:Uncharacterized protein n=1 Tax=Rhynchophorus ferrugineus TaxID=354439 RepID=A0A834M392_RHYFE|nr:hypothetical protein GWI33_016526 [Rhynchophorus ferrugineus]